MADPWTALHERSHLVLIRAPISERGRYYHRLGAIVLRTGMLLVEERSTLWHELVHADRGDEHCGHLAGKQERWCVREAARRAIDIYSLAEAFLWSEQLDEVADDLKVTRELLQTRLEYLHPAERGYLRQRLLAREGVA